MSTVPKYPYEVERHFAIGTGTSQRSREIKSFETLLAAIGFRDAAVRMHNTKRVVMRIILDDWSPSTASVGEETNGTTTRASAPNGHGAPAASGSHPHR